jgi:hypothetical protein
MAASEIRKIRPDNLAIGISRCRRKSRQKSPHPNRACKRFLNVQRSTFQRYKLQRRKKASMKKWIAINLLLQQQRIQLRLRNRFQFRAKTIWQRFSLPRT